jgi:hypothetical protein
MECVKGVRTHGSRVKVYELSELSCPANRLYVSVMDPRVYTGSPTCTGTVHRMRRSPGCASVHHRPAVTERLAPRSCGPDGFQTMTVGVSHVLLWV